MNLRKIIDLQLRSMMGLFEVIIERKVAMNFVVEGMSQCLVTSAIHSPRTSDVHTNGLKLELRLECPIAVIAALADVWSSFKVRGTRQAITTSEVSSITKQSRRE